MSTVDAAKMEFFELGDKTSLVCADPTTSEIVRAALRDLGFKSHSADSSDSALERVRYTQYDCIVIHENFAGTSLRSCAVLQYLTPLPMAQRRYTFVCVIGPSFKTMDAMQAFVQSVDLVVTPADISSLTAILKRSLAEFEHQHHVYKEVAAV